MKISQMCAALNTVNFIRVCIISLILQPDCNPHYFMWLKIELVFSPATDDPEMCAVEVGPLMVSTVVVFASPPLELTPADRADTPADTWGPADPNTADWPTVIIGVNKLWQTSSWCGCCYPLVWAANQGKKVWILMLKSKANYFHDPCMMLLILICWSLFKKNGYIPL